MLPTADMKAPLFGIVQRGEHSSGTVLLDRRLRNEIQVQTGRPCVPRSEAGAGSVALRDIAPMYRELTNQLPDDRVRLDIAAAGPGSRLEARRGEADLATLSGGALTCPICFFVRVPQTRPRVPQAFH